MPPLPIFANQCINLTEVINCTLVAGIKNENWYKKVGIFRSLSFVITIWLDKKVFSTKLFTGCFNFFWYAFCSYKRLRALLQISIGHWHNINLQCKNISVQRQRFQPSSSRFIMEYSSCINYKVEVKVGLGITISFLETFKLDKLLPVIG